MPAVRSPTSTFLGAVVVGVYAGVQFLKQRLQLSPSNRHSQPDNAMTKSAPSVQSAQWQLLQAYQCKVEAEDMYRAAQLQVARTQERVDPEHPEGEAARAELAGFLPSSHAYMADMLTYNILDSGRIACYRNDEYLGIRLSTVADKLLQPLVPSDHYHLEVKQLMQDASSMVKVTSDGVVSGMGLVAARDLPAGTVLPVPGVLLTAKEARGISGPEASYLVR